MDLFFYFFWEWHRQHHLPVSSANNAVPADSLYSSKQSDYMLQPRLCWYPCLSCGWLTADVTCSSSHWVYRILRVPTDLSVGAEIFCKIPFGLVVMAADTVWFVSYGVKVRAQPSLPTSAVPSIRFESDTNSTIYQCRVLIMLYQLTPCIVQNSLIIFLFHTSNWEAWICTDKVLVLLLSYDSSFRLFGLKQKNQIYSKSWEINFIFLYHFWGYFYPWSPKVEPWVNRWTFSPPPPPPPSPPSPPPPPPPPSHHQIFVSLRYRKRRGGGREMGAFAVSTILFI